MNKFLEPIDENERNIDWEDVETKISIICRKFDNISSRYQDDLAQELRIHAYYISDDYYDLQRKAIDFWRTLQVRVMPEVPFFDLELVGGAKLDDESTVEFENIVSLIRKELAREGKNYYDDLLLQYANKVLDVIVMDIDGSNPSSKTELNLENGTSTPYVNKRISCTYLSEILPDIHYKSIQKSLKLLEEIVQGLAAMGKISIDEVYQMKFEKKEEEK